MSFMFCQPMVRRAQTERNKMSYLGGYHFLWNGESLINIRKYPGNIFATPLSAIRNFYDPPYPGANIGFPSQFRTYVIQISKMVFQFRNEIDCLLTYPCQFQRKYRWFHFRAFDFIFVRSISFLGNQIHF